jgi:putative two-component system response regulator
MATPDLDLILLDVMMPGVDGYETCRQLKADPQTADVPVIFLTAKSQVEDEAMGLTLGAVDYLTKPISPPILFARVATQVNLRAGQPAVARAVADAGNTALRKEIEELRRLRETD